MDKKQGVGAPASQDGLSQAEPEVSALRASIPSVFSGCGDDGCEECDVCRYLGFLDWVRAVGKPEGSTVERDEPLEAYLRAAYPGIAL